MKIWVIHEDASAGNEFHLFYSQEEADAWALERCRNAWIHMQEFELDANLLIAHKDGGEQK